MSSHPDSKRKKSQKPPRRYWQAAERFVDLRLSHWIQIVLTIALLIVAASQALIYFRQAKIMGRQTALMNGQLEEIGDRPVRRIKPLLSCETKLA